MNCKNYSTDERKKANIFSENLFDKTIDKHMFVLYDKSRTNVLDAFVFEKEVHMMREMRVRECAASKRAIRRKKIMKQKIFLLSFFCMIMILSCGYALASDGKEQHKGIKYYTSIEVEAGDTLWDLAGVYASSDYDVCREEFINEVKKINHLSDDRITAGMYLTIPYYETE